MNKTEESIFTLVSLYVLIRQHFNTLLIHEKHFSQFLDNLKEEDLQEEPWVIEDTIYEAIVHQIILKTCAFMDEWNRVFGIKTLKKDQDSILWIKQTVKSATTIINKWDDLKTYRNEVIAHNHRDKKGNNIYLNNKYYHTPQSINEIGLIIFCLEKCCDIVKLIFEDSLGRIIKRSSKERKDITQTKSLKNSEIKKIMDSIDNLVYKDWMKIKIMKSLNKKIIIINQSPLQKIQKYL